VKSISKSPSHPLHKTIHHALFAGPVELDGQLVAIDGGDVAVAEFLLEDAVAIYSAACAAAGCNATSATM
jgi:hypothetical protein